MRSREGQRLSELRVELEHPDGTRELLYNPQERQEELHRCTAPNVLYGGEAGGGKSHGARWHGIMACARLPGLKVLLLRREFAELEISQLVEIPVEVPEALARWHAQLKRLQFPNGSIMQFGHCQYENDVQKYLSSQWDMIILDEGTTFTPRQIRMLQSRLRSTMKGIRPQLVIASNPGGDGHVYVLQRFIEKSVPEGEQKNYRKEDYAFIPAKLEDNEYLEAEEYDARLQNLSEDEYRAYRGGDWYSFTGQYFKEWSPKVHTAPPTSIEIPDWWEIMGGGDWGYSPNPAYFAWCAFDELGRGIGYKELVLTETSPRECAELIAERCETEMERRMIFYCDTQMWTKQPNVGISIADEINDRLAEIGLQVTLQPANKDRMNGWARVHQFLKPTRPHPDRKNTPGPWLRFLKHDPETNTGCPYIIATIGAQVHDDKMNGDMKKSSNDHGCDGWRYMLMQREPLSSMPKHLQSQTHEKKVQTRTREILLKSMAEHNRSMAAADDELDAMIAAHGIRLEDLEENSPESDALDSFFS